jgi:hypothetical protein
MLLVLALKRVCDSAAVSVVTVLPHCPFDRENKDHRWFRDSCDTGNGVPQGFLYRTCALGLRCSMRCN